MKISILGTGVVGQTIAEKTFHLNHNVFMGSRNAKDAQLRTDPNPMTGISFSQWYQKNKNIKLVNFNELPHDSELFINATGGIFSIEALNLTGRDKLEGKIIIDIANPLDFSKGMPPTLTICNTGSLGEQIQNEFPNSYVVKTLNTMNAYLMVNPGLLPENHNVFISGNNSKAKSTVTKLLNEFGWKNSDIIDLGDISTCRGTEMVLPLWLRLWSSLGTPQFNFKIVK